jgi:CheY-like chemotaxis protein
MLGGAKIDNLGGLMGAARCHSNAAAPYPHRILVVDDYRDAADSLGMLLKLLGYDTCIAFDGEQALAAAADFHPDVVLLDLQMPKLSGYEAARLLRKQRWGRNISIVALTGCCRPEDQRRAHEIGFDHYLVKPVTADELQKLLTLLRMRSCT